jgi:hypothetical protein
MQKVVNIKRGGVKVKIFYKIESIEQFLDLRMITVLLIGCLLLISASQAKAIMIGLCTEDLTRASEIIVVGEVRNVESHWNSDGTTIVTSASILVKDVVKGEQLEQMITVEYEGGEVGDIGLKVSDTVPLVTGEEVLLFLKSDQDAGVNNYSIVGRAQGKYIISKNGIASKTGFSLTEGKEAVDNDIPLTDLIEKIRRVK